MASNNPLRLSLNRPRRPGRWRRLWRYLCWLMPVGHPVQLPPSDVRCCTVKPARAVTLIGLSEMPLASLMQGDLRVERMALGFDETRGAGRTLEYYDRALSCACPADCIQHPWRK